MKKQIAYITALALISGALTGCAAQSSEEAPKEAAETAEAEAGTDSVQDTEDVSAPDKIDSAKWQYNSDDHVYSQIGISYCASPADESYETLSVFIPEAYMDAADNGDGTFTCTVNPTAVSGSYTADAAPIVLPVNTPGYSAQAALTEYQSFTEYTDEGIVYVHAGCRGRDAGAPSGVTDLKAAIRYLRYNADNIAGDTEKIFSFGMSGGGAQSALLGVTGDSALYEDYLQGIGAVMDSSDAVYGSMAWCPITSLDSANEAYEWNMGVTRTDLSEEEQELSNELVNAFAEYINASSLTDSDGNLLTLEQSEDGLWQAGSYYEYIKSTIEASLNQFLAETTFPYDADSSSQGGPGGGMGGHGGVPNGGPDGAPGGGPDGAPGGGPDSAPDGAPEGADNAPGGGPDSAPGGAEMTAAMDMPQDGDVDYTQIDDISRTENNSGITVSGTYETPQDYIDALNANGEWVMYDAETNTAVISSVHDFSKAMKTSSKGLGAFDQLDAGQGENTLFGYGDGQGAHFDAVMSDILTSLGSEYADAYAEDLQKTDALGHTAAERLNMYSPLYYLLESSDGYQTSTVAPHFRIRSGICQSDTSVTTEINLAQALTNEGVDVDFAAVWGQKHVQAETSGNSTENFISWIHDCLTK